MNKQPIGIFDSGVGGLTVFKQIEKLLPHEDIIYFGDTARVPYGNKSKSTIIRFSRQSAHLLIKKRVKLIIVACNTSSALALKELKRTFSQPIIGVIDAGAKRAVSLTKNRRIGIIATRSTIASKSYDKALKKRNPKVKVYSQSCPLFVPLVEEGFLSGKITKEVIKKYLKPLKAKRIDVLILGCTHYPLLTRQIAGYMNGVAIVDSAKEVARHTKRALLENNLLSGSKRKGRRESYVSDEPREFLRLARMFLRRRIPLPKVVRI